MVSKEITKFTKYEKARMVGSRALQIAMGSPFFIELNERDLKKLKFNPIAIAKKEFDEGVIPLEVIKPFPK